MLTVITSEFSVTCQLGLEAAEIACSREQVRKILPRWGIGKHADVAELILGELATNAQRHSCCSINMSLSYYGHCLRIEIWDCSASLPNRQQPAPDDEMGRGLQIVDSLVEEYGGVRGILLQAGRPGKAVFILLPI